MKFRRQPNKKRKRKINKNNKKIAGPEFINKLRIIMSLPINMMTRLTTVADELLII